MKIYKSQLPLCLKIIQNVAFEFLNIGIFHQFCLLKVDLSGNTVWPQDLDFQKLVKIDFLSFLMNFCLLKM